VNYRKRQKWLQSVLSDAGLDALLITHLPNVQYLCGFTGSAAALLIAEKQIVLFTDGRYTAQARAEVLGARIVIGRKAVLATFTEWLRSQKSINRKIRKLGFECEHMVFASHHVLAKNLPAAINLRPASALVEQARIIKDSEEVERIEAAALLGADLFNEALKVLRPGVKETEVAAEMEYAASRRGAEGMSFHTIVASGKRSALPHGRASAQPIQPDGFVVCDFGVILASYCSDMTRTVYVGQPTAEAHKTYNAVREAQQAALDAVRPGQTVGEVDQAARKVLQKHKLARYFTHSTGHGVGLEIHEPPRVGAGQREVLRPGMVITIEPGVYLPGKWGVRIEDMALVTERGYKVLTPISKELITV
jgi:Xaa-Pro aminopeptidase